MLNTSLRSYFIKPLFSKGPSYLSRVIGLIIISVVLISIGRYTTWLSPARQYLDSFSTPFYGLTNFPTQVEDWFANNVSSYTQLTDENTQLREQVLVQQAQLQKMLTLESENSRLRALMNSSQLLRDEILVAELMGISPDPKVHKIIINKGFSDDVYVGQAVLDAFGLMGQVVSVTYNTAEVLFITDTTHAIPVQINRNGVRTVVEGIGDLYRLTLSYVPNTMDIVEGDLLISSGLGGRFPSGYPVAQVESITHDPGHSFATVYAKPTAQLNRSRHVLLVFRESDRKASAPRVDQAVSSADDTLPENTLPTDDDNIIAVEPTQ